MYPYSHDMFLSSLPHPAPSSGASNALAARLSVTAPNAMHGLVLASPLESTAHLALQFLLTEVSFSCTVAVSLSHRRSLSAMQAIEDEVCD
jgi:hypothetical protein